MFSQSRSGLHLIHKLPWNHEKFVEMNDIRAVIKRALSEGLPSRFERFEETVGPSFNAVKDIKEWAPVQKILYEAKANEKVGLLYDLEELSNEVAATFDKAVKACQDSDVALNEIAEQLSVSSPPIAPLDILAAVEKAVGTLETALDAVTTFGQAPKQVAVPASRDPATDDSAQTKGLTGDQTVATTQTKFLGNEASDSAISVGTLEGHVSKMRNVAFAALRRTLSSTISTFDILTLDRFTFENSFETRRLSKPEYFSVVCDSLSDIDCRPRGIRIAWRSNNIKAYEFKINKLKIDETMSSDVFQFLKDRNSVSLANPIHRSTMKEYLEDVKSLLPASLKIGDNGREVVFPSYKFEVGDSTKWGGEAGIRIQSIGYYMTCLATQLTHKGEQNLGGKIWYGDEVREWDELYRQLQCIAKGLSKPDGPWSKEEDQLQSRNGSYQLRERLDTVDQCMRELEEMTVRLRTTILVPLEELLKGLLLDLHDLHVSLYFGHVDDQKETIKQFKESSETWHSVLGIENLGNMKKNILEVLPQQCFFTTTCRNNKSQRATLREGGIDASRFISGLTCIDAAHNKDLAVRTFCDNFGNPTVNPMDENAFIYEAAAQFVEMNSIVEANYAFGTQSIQASDGTQRTFKDPVDYYIKFSSMTEEFSSPPKVVVWLTGVWTSCIYNHRVNVEAINVTKDGFTLRMNTWGDTVLRSLEAGWFAHPEDSPYLASGRATINSKRGCHSIDEWAPFATVEFPKKKFEDRPRVFAPISKLDLDRRTNPRYRVSVADLTKTGMRLVGDAWYDTDHYLSHISWIAFDDRFFKRMRQSWFLNNL